MTTKNEELQKLVQLYKVETANKIVDMDAVAEWAIKKGVIPPKPKSPIELLSARLAQAQREEHKIDPATGWAYRVNHALRFKKGDGVQYTLWGVLEDFTRDQMHLSLTNRRQQMMGEGVQIKIDEHVWNSRNPNKEPLQLIMDFTDDIEERLNSPDMTLKAA
jgi:hypothetical protein